MVVAEWIRRRPVQRLRARHQLQCQDIALCFQFWNGRADTSHNAPPLNSLKVKGLCAPLWAVSVFDSDRRKPRSASTSARIERRIWSGKCGSSPISKRDAAGSVIHAGKLANEPSGWSTTTNSKPPHSSRRLICTHFAKTRMEPVGDTGFSRLFVRSMSPFRVTAGQHANFRRAGR
jgi:hypothetical protein